MAHGFDIDVGVHGDAIKFVVFGLALEIFRFKFGDDAEDAVGFIQICGHLMDIGIIERVLLWIFFALLVLFWFEFEQVGLF